MVIFYNRDLFKAAGVPEPKPGWTMDEFKAAAKKLTTGGRTGLVTQPGDLGVTSWVRTMTGAEPLADGKLTFTDPKFTEGFQGYADFVRTDKIARRCRPATPISRASSSSPARRRCS